MRLVRYTGKRNIKKTVVAQSAHMGICGSYDDPHPGEGHIVRDDGVQNVMMLDFDKSSDGKERHTAYLSKRDCLHLIRKTLMECKHLGITDLELLQLRDGIARMLGEKSDASA